MNFEIEDLRNEINKDNNESNQIIENKHQNEIRRKNLSRSHGKDNSE